MTPWQEDDWRLDVVIALGNVDLYAVPVCFALGTVANMLGALSLMTKLKMSRKAFFFILAWMGLADSLLLVSQLQRWLSDHYAASTFLLNHTSCKLYLIASRLSVLLSCSLMLLFAARIFIRVKYGAPKLSIFSTCGQLVSRIAVFYIFVVSLALSWHELWTSGIRNELGPVFEHEIELSSSNDQDDAQATLVSALVAAADAETFYDHIHLQSHKQQQQHNESLQQHQQQQQLQQPARNFECVKNLFEISVISYLNAFCFVLEACVIVGTLVFALRSLHWLRRTRRRAKREHTRQLELKLNSGRLIVSSMSLSEMNVLFEKLNTGYGESTLNDADDAISFYLDRPLKSQIDSYFDLRHRDGTDGLDGSDANASNGNELTEDVISLGDAIILSPATAADAASSLSESKAVDAATSNIHDIVSVAAVSSSSPVVHVARIASPGSHRSRLHTQRRQRHYHHDHHPHQQQQQPQRQHRQHRKHHHHHQQQHQHRQHERWRRELDDTLALTQVTTTTTTAVATIEEETSLPLEKSVKRYTSACGPLKFVIRFDGASRPSAHSSVKINERQFIAFVITSAICTAVFALPYVYFDYSYYTTVPGGGANRSSNAIRLRSMPVPRSEEEAQERDALVGELFAASLSQLPLLLVNIPHMVKFYFLFFMCAGFRARLANFFKMYFKINI